MNPFTSFVERHYKMMAFCSIETCHTTFFHFIDTVKVRLQARNAAGEDISHFYKNKVKEAPLISGVVSGFLGAAAGSMTFMFLHDYLTL